jgi:hypothetical protein
MLPKPKPSIERYRPPKPKSPAEFAPLSREILSQPPLRHRGELPEAGLSVSEFVTGVAATILARRDREHHAHRAGLRAGKRAMDAQRSSEQPVKNKARYLDSHGSAGFEHGRQRYRDDHADEDWYFETSRGELLRYAGLSDNAANSKRVDADLDRLTRPVFNRPSVLVRWRESSGQWIELEVRREWLSLERYTTVKMPLPTSSRDALALYLFLSSINLSPRNRTGIPAKALYVRLGIRTGRPSHDEKALRQALARVNEHRTKKQGLSPIGLSPDRKGGWRFNEHGKPKAISADTIDWAIAMRRDGFSWQRIADINGHTPLDIRQAVEAFESRQTTREAESEDVQDGDRRKRPVKSSSIKRKPVAVAPNDQDDESEDDDDDRDRRERRLWHDRCYDRQRETKERDREYFARCNEMLKKPTRDRGDRVEIRSHSDSDAPVDDSDAGITAWCKAQGWGE